MIGEKCVGKSCMLQHYTEDLYLEVDWGESITRDLGYSQCCAEFQLPAKLLLVPVGHKYDRKMREVNQEEVEEFTSALGAPYIEATARTGLSVTEAFELLTQHIYQGYMSGEVSLHERWGKIHKANKTNKY